MPFNLLLLPLLGGFIFFSHWNRTAFFAKRQDRERLLFYSSLWGILFLGLSFLLSILAPHLNWLESLQQWWAYNTPSLQFSGISSCALLLGTIGQFTLNRLGPVTRTWTEEGETVIARHGSQLEKLFLRSLMERKHLMLTLKNGKIYVGRLTSVVPNEDRDLLLLPSKSGYRDDQQRLIFTTDYDEIYLNIMEAEDNYVDAIADFGVVIPIPEILTANLYDAGVHANYFTHHDKPRVTHRRRNATRRK